MTFPIPQNLREVNKLRHSSEMVSFRDFFSPWMNTIVAGEFDEFEKLKKEIQDCVKAFKRYPKVRKFGHFAGYGSLAAGVVEAASGIIGPSIVAGLVGIGMTQLAKDWEKRSNWLYLTI